MKKAKLVLTVLLILSVSVLIYYGNKPEDVSTVKSVIIDDNQADENIAINCSNPCPFNIVNRKCVSGGNGKYISVEDCEENLKKSS